MHRLFYGIRSNSMQGKIYIKQQYHNYLYNSVNIISLRPFVLGYLCFFAHFLLLSFYYNLFITNFDYYIFQWKYLSLSSFSLLLSPVSFYCFRFIFMSPFCFLSAFPDNTKFLLLLSNLYTPHTTKTNLWFAKYPSWKSFGKSEYSTYTDSDEAAL